MKLLAVSLDSKNRMGHDLGTVDGTPIGRRD